MTPILIKIRLPINHTERINEVQPEIIFPEKYDVITYIPIIISRKSKIKPTINIILIGFAENEVIPSIEKLSILLNGYFDSPAIRSLRSYSTTAVFSPIWGIMPLKNRFDSPYLLNKCKARLLINR